MSSITPKRLDRTAFPHRVFDLPMVPKHLYLVGELPRGPAVAVVGTRHPTTEAIQYTAELVEGLTALGVTVWSGGAAGIDIAAHRAAMRMGAPTVVVAPAGWERPYPDYHAETYRDIVESGGAYLSLVSPRRVAQRHLFFARNALLVALVDALVVVQAGLRSGARNAANHARRLGRAVFVAPSCPWVPQGKGCNAELSLGARVLASPKQVVKAMASYGLSRASFPSIAHTERKLFEDSAPGSEPLSGTGTVTRTQRQGQRTVALVHSIPDLDAELSQLLEAIRDGARTVDELCDRSGLPPAVVQSDVLRLTLQGLVQTGRAGSIEIVNT